MLNFFDRPHFFYIVNNLPTDYSIGQWDAQQFLVWKFTKFEKQDDGLWSLKNLDLNFHSV